MAGAGTGQAAMPMGGMGFAGGFQTPTMPTGINPAGGLMNIGRSGQVKPSGQYSGGFMGQGPAIQPAAPAFQMQTVQVNPNTGRPFASSREQMQYLLPDANLSTGRQLYTPPMATQRPGVDVPGINLPFRPQPVQTDFKTQLQPLRTSPGGNFFTGDQGRQMYQPPMPKAPPGMMIPQVMPAPIEVGPQAPAKPQPGATPPFNPAGGPVSQPIKQAPIRIEPADFGPSNESVFERSARGVRAAMGATGTEMGYQPSQVQGFSYQSGDVTPTIGPYAGDVDAPRTSYAGDVTGMGYSAPSIAQNIGQFVNPFEQQVVSGALGDIERQRQMQANQLASQFGAAKAFGGSRQAIQEAELARSAMEQGASTATALRQQGFGQALQAAGQQAQMGARAEEFGLGQGLQAQLANQAARQRFGEFGAQQGMQASLANQAARQRFGEYAGGQSMQAQLANQAAQARAREFGLGQSMQAQLANQAAKLAGSQQRMGAASQLANLANLGFGMGQTVQQQMAQQGAMQQQLQQQIMNAARQQFEGFRNYPAQALGYYAQALGATPTPQSSTTSRQPGLFDYLTLGASLL